MSSSQELKKKIDILLWDTKTASENANKDFPKNFLPNIKKIINLEEKLVAINNKSCYYQSEYNTLLIRGLKDFNRIEDKLNKKVYVK